MCFTQQIGNPNATYPPSLTLAQSANGVGLVSIGSDVKYVTFNPIPSYSWIPLSTNPYENYFIEWYTGTDFSGDYYEGYTPDFATFNALNVRTLDLYYDEPRLSGIVNLDQYPNLDTLDLEYYDGNDISFLYTLPVNMYYLYLHDLPNVPNQQFSTLLASLSNCTAINYVGINNIGEQLTDINVQNVTLPVGLLDIQNNNQLTTITFQSVSQLQNVMLNDSQFVDVVMHDIPQLQTLNLRVNQLTAATLQDLPQLEELYLNNNQLSTITLQDFPQLQIIHLNNNQLTNVVLQGLSQLNTVFLQNNPLRHVSISQISSLTFFQINDTTLNTIEVVDLPQIEMLSLNGNQISGVTLQNLPSLIEVNFTLNQLSSLTLQDHTQLQQITCRNNPLKTLVLRGLGVEVYMRFTDVPELTYVDMTGISAQTAEFPDNNLPLSAVNHIAVQCDLGGIINGYLYLQGGTNSPLSGEGLSARDNLIAKGWNVTSNP